MPADVEAGVHVGAGDHVPADVEAGVHVGAGEYGVKPGVHVAAGDGEEVGTELWGR